MVSKSTRNILLIAGGAAVAGYFLLRKTEEAVSGIAAPLAGIPAGIQAGATALGTGLVESVGAAGTGFVGGGVEAFRQGLEDVLRPDLPLRTYEPVLDVRQIPLEQQIGWTEQPVITVEQYEAQQAAARQPAPAPEPVPLSISQRIAEGVWTPPIPVAVAEQLTPLQARITVPGYLTGIAKQYAAIAAAQAQAGGI